VDIAGRNINSVFALMEEIMHLVSARCMFFYFQFCYFQNNCRPAPYFGIVECCVTAAMAQ
jgi:hypothetical protein